MTNQQEIISYYSENPFNNFKLENSNISHFEESRVCGDTIEIFLKIENDKIIDFSFIWNTSIITKVSASAFWESIIWMDIVEILNLKIDYIEELIWEVSPRRKHWATLGLLATRNTIHNYLKDNILDDFSDVLE